VVGRRLTPAWAAALGAAATLSLTGDGGRGPLVDVVVSERAPATSAAERTVASAGGTVLRRLPIADGLAVRLPLRNVPRLRASAAVAAVWRDAPVTALDFDDDDIRDYDALPENTVWREAIGLDELPGAGAGVTVAVLDTGIARVPDLEDAVKARADLTPDRDGSDRYGHGTHMAGIVAGDGAASGGTWRGVAPDASVVALKVAGWDGSTDVSAVLAGLQWVVSHRAQYGIRVLNLSFGNDSYASWLRDPLNLAVQRVWKSGIVVVVAAGNRGSGDGTIAKPGDDPYVLTVGAADLRGTADRADDVVAGFSSRGPTPDGIAKPDLVAPGVTIVAPRAPGSTVDSFRPLARVGEDYFKGTGSSQAAAVVSGIAARLLERRPTLTPNQVKTILVATADPTLRGQAGAGAGLVDAAAAFALTDAGPPYGPNPNAGLASSSGLGPLNESRGSVRVWTDCNGDGRPDKVDNEVDALCAPWDPARYAAARWTPTTWRSSPWAPLTGSASGWAALPPGGSWPGMSAEEETWGAKYWTESPWEAKYWTGKYWTTSQWH
jgi:serine protease AprX